VRAPAAPSGLRAIDEGVASTGLQLAFLLGRAASFFLADPFTIVGAAVGLAVVNLPDPRRLTVGARRRYARGMSQSALKVAA